MIEEILARLDRLERKLDRLLGLPTSEPPPEPEQWLEPCRIAARLGVTEAYVRKLCSRGQRGGVEGVRKEGGRWLATIEAIEAQRRVSGAF